MNDLPQGVRSRLHRQAALAEDLAQEAHESVFSRRSVLDRMLSGTFRSRPGMGSHDRKFCGEAIFAAFRHWGVLRKFLNAEERDLLEKEGRFMAPRPVLGRMLWCALKLENLEFPPAQVWQPPGKAGMIPPGLPYLQRAQSVLKMAGLSVAVTNADLLPDWVRSSLCPGIDAEVFCRDLARRPPLWVRVQKGTPEELLAAFQDLGMSCRRHERMVGAIALYRPAVNLYTLPQFREGRFEVQDLASQMVCLAAAPGARERWLDCCAGAGGKTLHLASLLNNRGSVTAMEVRSWKLDDLRLRARRAGFCNILCKSWDGKAPRKKHAGSFDGVLVDAPCSCSGVWRRNPEGRWTLTAQEVGELAVTQRRILANASENVKAGGVLVYATCSVLKMENDDVVADFLASHPDFALEPCLNPLTGNGTDGRIQIRPGDGDCDCLFAARFRRKGGNA